MPLPPKGTAGCHGGEGTNGGDAANIEEDKSSHVTPTESNKKDKKTKFVEENEEHESSD